MARVPWTKTILTAACAALLSQIPAEAANRAYLEFPDPPRAWRPPPNPNEPDFRLPVLPANPPARPESADALDPDPEACLGVAEFKARDRDGDAARNEAALASPELCLSVDTFQEGGLRWTLQVVRSRRTPGAYLWVALHDNENAAFDSAVYAVGRYGGTMVAVETGGARFNGPQDPNRNFDAGGPSRCREQVARSPLFTARVMRHKAGKETPVLALHTNEPGFSGDGSGGAGGISMRMRSPGTWPVRAPRPLPTASPDDSMVFVASKGGRGSNPRVTALIDGLTRSGLNVIHEGVTEARNDCSMSNYAALTGLRDYVNIEVVHSDRAGQKTMVDAVVGILRGDPVLSREPVATVPPAAALQAPVEVFAPEPAEAAVPPRPKVEIRRKPKPAEATRAEPAPEFPSATAAGPAARQPPLRLSPFTP